MIIPTTLKLGASFSRARREDGVGSREKTQHAAMLFWMPAVHKGVKEIKSTLLFRRLPKTKVLNKCHCMGDLLKRFC